MQILVYILLLIIHDSEFFKVSSELFTRQGNFCYFFITIGI